MVDPRNFTCEQWMELGGPVHGDASPGSFEQLKNEVQACLGPVIRPLADGYVLHELTTSGGDIGVTLDGELAGFYMDSTCSVGTQHQRQGLGMELVKEGLFRRSTIIPQSLSNDGKRLWLRVWLEANDKASNKIADCEQII